MDKRPLLDSSALLALAGGFGVRGPATGEHRMQIEPREATFRLVINKGERRLLVFRSVGGGEELDRTLKVGLGSQPTGSKTKQGDGATPEGEYYITHRNAASRYHLSLGISYPNASDASVGLTRGLLTRTQYQSIIRAIRQLEKPPQNTALGGDIFIHGGGTTGDWTAGCIALENQDIEYLFARLPLKTKVTIFP
ncbi:MAG: L,D-transpeptidase family protein [Acidobacteriota bacterium]